MSISSLNNSSQPTALQNSVPPLQRELNNNKSSAGRWPRLFMLTHIHHYFRLSYHFSRLPLMKSPCCSRHAPPTDAVSCDASHGSKRRLPWFYLEEVDKLFYCINLCTQSGAPVNGKINRCTVFVYNRSE